MGFFNFLFFKKNMILRDHHEWPVNVEQVFEESQKNLQDTPSQKKKPKRNSEESH